MNSGRRPSATTCAPATSGAIVAHHGRIYLPEYGVDSTFEAHVGASVAAAGKRGFPGERERLWIVELDGAPRRQPRAHRRGRRPRRRCAGSCSTASCAATGLGRRLIAELLDARRARRLRRALARDLQRPARGGRTSTAHTASRWSSEETGPRWGRERAHLPALRAQLPGPRPVLELGERRLERAALLGQRVGDAGRRSAVDRALDQARRPRARAAAARAAGPRARGRSRVSSAK